MSCPAALETFANDLRELGRPVVAGFSTHPHWDHLLWHAHLGAAPRYGTARCAATVRVRLLDPLFKARVAELIPPDIAEQVPLDLLGLITGLPAETARIPWDGPEVRMIEHQAHAPGHAALLIEERGVLVAGDMLSDVLIPMLDLNGTADPIEDYLAALRLLEGAAGDVDVLVPGHGSVGGAVRYTHGSTRIGRMCTPYVTPMFQATRGSAHRPRTARIGCPACTHGNSSTSPKEASATGRPASDRCSNVVWQPPDPTRLTCAGNAYSHRRSAGVQVHNSAQRGRRVGFIAVSDARSLLFVPGNRPDRFERARDSGAGGIILDLEDAVGELEKDMARAQVQRWLGAGGTGAVRVNAVGTPWHDEDLEALLKVAPSTTVMVPKATPESIAATQRRLPLSGQIVALLETAAGVLDARSIAHARGVSRLAFGNVDLGAEIGVDPDNRTALGWARSMLVLASAAAGIAPPLDGVTTSINDEEALAESTVAARSVGFSGKLCIHPSQIATVHRLFAPTQDEIEYAERVLAAATENVSVLDGRMLDRPVVERARRILGRDAGHG